MSHKEAMRKRNQPDYFDKQLKQNKDIEYDGDFSGPGVTEFGLNLDTDELRNMSPEELEVYLRREARKRSHRGRGKQH
jgi:hypothetical protein